MPKLSVIIPSYNAESTLKRCLDSILSQSFRDLEIICVDDYSDDGTADILQDYVRREPRVHASAFQRRLQTVLARKLALLDAHGEYIMFADADDMFLPGACETAVRLMEESRTDIVQFSIELESDRKDAGYDRFNRYFNPGPMELHGANILYDCFVNHRFPHNLWNKIYRADICRKAVAVMPDIQLHHYTDLYLSFFLLFFAESFRSFTTKPCYRYHFGGGVSTKAPDAEQFKALCDTSKTLPLMEKFLRDRNAYEANVSVLDAIRWAYCQDVINKLLTIPTLTGEIISTAVSSWGADIVFMFLDQTGMLKYPCENRLSLVSNLIDRVNTDRKTIAELRSDLTLAREEISRISPRDSQSQHSSARMKKPQTSSTIKQEDKSAPQKEQFRFVQKLPKI